MDSLDNIWDEPADETVVSRSSAAPQEPLFLEDSDDENSRQLPPQNIANIDVDLDAIFADVENEDDPFAINPLTSNLNTEALTRAAEARHRKAAPPSLTPHAIMSSSPPRDTGGDQTTGKTRGDKGNDGKKERRKPMRLDEGRLLGPKGFPKLIKDTKNFRAKGKGHEISDLNRLLQMYGYWTHELYPKTTFRDTVERVEKLCHSKRMHVSLSVWRDEAHGLVNGRQLEDDDEIIDLTENPEGDPTDHHHPSSRGSSPVSTGAAYASSSSRPPSHPPSSDSEVGDDDFDIDAVIRDEEERLARERDSSNSINSLTTPQGTDGDNTVNDDTEDANMWEALDAMEETLPQATHIPVISSIDNDEAMWNELDALHSVTKPTHSLLEKNTDEEMWDVVDEMENSTEPHSIPEDEWDTVYA